MKQFEVKLNSRLLETDSNISQIGQYLMTTYLKRTDDYIKEIILKYAEPPIKGEITKRKLKFRNIKLIRTTDSIWIEQKGEIIGKKISFDFNEQQVFLSN